MHQICHEARQGNFLSKIQRTVDGVVLESRDERDEDCVITFQTESILEKFLLKFERLQMDCNDHLYIYDGAHVAGPWRAHISCDSEPLSVGSNGFIITRTNFVTLRYHTDSWGSANNGFNLVITAFKNAQTLGCGDGFQCDSHICISRDLVCDNVSHCGHGEDEIANNFCSGDKVYDLIGLEAGQAVGAGLLILLLLISGVTAAWIWSYRSGGVSLDSNTHAQTYSFSVKKKEGMEQRLLSDGQIRAGVTSTADNSGNLDLPVQDQGYRHINIKMFLV